MTETFPFDFSEIRGANDVVHAFAKALLQTTQAILLCGLPGTGACMLARRGASMLGGPLRAPHHTISVAGMVGCSRTDLDGNQSFAPGEAQLAQNGILFIDDVQHVRPIVLHQLASTSHGGRVVFHAIPFDGNPVFESNVARLEQDFGPLIRIDLPVIPYRKLHDAPAGPSTAELLELYG